MRQISTRQSVQSVLEVARSNLLSSLLQLFKRHLHAPKHLPLHEVFYFDQEASLSQHMAATLRTSVQQGLSYPAGYITTRAVGGASHEVPDICIMYQLHLEYGKLINLYDWLQVMDIRIHHKQL